MLARQLLLDRAALPLPRALERVAGIQAQYAPSMYVGLWARLESFEREALTRALQRRTVVQGTLMRTTIHLVSRRDWWPFAVAGRERRRQDWLRTRRGTSEKELAAAARRLRSRLADGPVRHADAAPLVGDVPMSGLHVRLELVRLPPSGTWERRRADLYALAEDWVGPEDVKPEPALEHSIRRYLAGFGPAPRTDIADWAGLKVGDVAPALERLRLRRFRSEDGSELLDLPRAPLPDPDTPAPVRFLPVWDATLLVHARRAGILPEEYRSRVFNTRTPHSVNTFLVDGRVAGTWKFDRGRVEKEPFERLDRATVRELRGEADRLADLYA